MKKSSELTGSIHHPESLRQAAEYHDALYARLKWVLSFGLIGIVLFVGSAKAASICFSCNQLARERMNRFSSTGVEQIVKHTKSKSNEKKTLTGETVEEFNLVGAGNEMQCTDGSSAEKDDHYAKIRMIRFSKDSTLRLRTAKELKLSETIEDDANKDGEITEEEVSTRATSRFAKVVTAFKKSEPKLHENAKYIGNGPIYKNDGSPNGYLVSGGRKRSALNCDEVRDGNLAEENSVLVRYRPKVLDSEGEESLAKETKTALVSSKILCGRFQENFKPKFEPKDLASEDQVEFAMQSGPGVLAYSENLLDADAAKKKKRVNGAPSYETERSYLGFDKDGKVVVVETSGRHGHFCLGEYLKKKGITHLLHRDTQVVASTYWDEGGNEVDMAVSNLNAKEDAKRDFPNGSVSSIFVIE